MKFSKIRTKIHVLVIALFFLPAIPMAANALPAFPGAQGFGSNTIGGRGGTIIKVTNLNDSGAGSLRAAFTASGPRIVIFTVGGTITLQSPIYIGNPYLTVAGQTAPGGGILIRGPNIMGGGGSPSIVVNTHDVVIRGLRIRDTGKATIEILSPTGTDVYNVIIDHNSLSWSTDSVTGTWVDPGETITNVTYSWNIISEGSGSHSSLMLVGAGDSCNRPVTKVSVHHNLFAHSGIIDRAPLIKHDINEAEVVNNVVYNWYWGGTRTMSPAYIAKNHYIAGPNTISGESQKGIQVSNAGECPQLPTSSVMVSHNIGNGKPTDTGDDWLIVQGGTSIFRTNTPYFTLSGVSEDDVSGIKALVLASAGATIPTRDSVDVRIVNDVNNGTGHFINSPSDVGGWPTIAGGTAPTDTDGDGMPDAWETAHGLNPNIASDAKIYAPSGYTWIEEYINGFFPPIGSFGSFGSSLSPPSGSIPNPPTIIGIN